MKITFISNYLTIHQISFCNYLANRDDIDFHFVSSVFPSGNKSSLSNYEHLDYVLRFYEPHLKEEVFNVVNSSDVVIFGSGDRSLIRNFKGLLYFYSEHPFKKYVGLLRKIHIYMIYSKFKNSYLLCSSWLSKPQYNQLHLFRKRTFKFGYFPLVNKIDFEKNNNELTILWIGRELNWKHPEIVFKLSHYLYRNKINFKFTMISTYESINKKLIEKNKNKPWMKCINFLGPISNEEVINKMKETSVFICSSDRQEGWGAVVNEAMSCKCLCLVSSKIGCSKYLIQDKVNGYIFKSFRQLKEILTRITNASYKDLQDNAYSSIANLWNADVAAERFVEVSKRILKKDNFDIFESGPMAKD